MARLARVIAADVPHHVTQRQVILDCDADRTVYLELLPECILLHNLSLVGYCPVPHICPLLANVGLFPTAT